MHVDQPCKNGLLSSLQSSLQSCEAAGCVSGIGGLIAVGGVAHTFTIRIMIHTFLQVLVDFTTVRMQMFKHASLHNWEMGH